jgi:hypothetical protein
MAAKLTPVCACLTIISLMLPCQSFARIDPETVAGAWLFDEEADVVEDVSGNGNNGIVKGDPDWDDGKFGGAISYDGMNDFVDCGAGESLSVGTDNFSLVAWIRAAEESPPNWSGNIISRFDTNAPRHGFLFGVRGALDAANVDKPLFLMGLGQASGAHLFGTSPITDDEWHHLAATVDRARTAKLYRDGVFEAEMNIAGSPNENEDNELNVNIGADSGNRWFFNGLLDEVALIKAVLTEAEIKDIMNEGLERVLGITAVSPTSKLTATWGSVKATVR